MRGTPSLALQVALTGRNPRAIRSYHLTGSESYYHRLPFRKTIF